MAKQNGASVFGRWLRRRGNGVFYWLFYGHLWIALAAAGLTWLSLHRSFGAEHASGYPVVCTVVFCATLGVYTLHRYLSFFRAKQLLTARRYGLVRRHPQICLLVGAGSLALALVLGADDYAAAWPWLLLALPMTVFYLTPPWPGWRRLRDLPYVKVIWVAGAWAIMTVALPGAVLATVAGREQTEAMLSGQFGLEFLVRFLFVLAVALLFDLRDVELDRAQGVRTVANAAPGVHRWLTYGALTASGVLGLLTGLPRVADLVLGLVYLAMLPVARLTYARVSEDWYAVVVNGLLLAPPVVYALCLQLGIAG
ncbi:hypothetical protein QWY85_05090 [Neolewinella lacunae]|uniref:Prenyltransferase n=1 Tax=Neolewinella lacunae TaxID=1517758 RepID=A0A923PL58_9BACT|nr:hypothetical protein [Neolewinella lacunae]MBC6996173.1 hypothetical protein [Neolewinella lacunae]MDN3634024.1 hypothetical protein [Neolewinella lacunae]